MSRTLLLTTLITASLALTGCQSVSNSMFGPDLQTQCKDGIARIFSRAQQPPAPGTPTTLNWVKTANLITSAQLKQSQHNYQGCVEDIKQADALAHPTNTTAAFVSTPAMGMPEVLAR